MGDAEAFYEVDDNYGLDASNINVASDAQLTGLSNLDVLARAQSTSGGNSEAFSKIDDSYGADLYDLKVGGVATIGGQSTTNSGAQAINVEG